LNHVALIEWFVAAASLVDEKMNPATIAILDYLAKAPFCDPQSAPCLGTKNLRQLIAAQFMSSTTIIRANAPKPQEI
jgi:hypothetical protein